MAFRFSYETGTMEIGRYRGVPIHLCSSFFIIAVVLTFPFWKQVNGAGLLLSLIFTGVLFVSILLHELAHAVVGRRYHALATRIDINVLGGVVYFTRRPQKAIEDAAITVAGPLSNLLIGLAAWGLLVLVAAEPAAAGGPPPAPAGILERALRATAYLNAGLCVVNLIPAFPLDGGRLAYLGITHIRSPQVGMMVVGSLGMVFAALSAVLFVVSILAGVPLCAPPEFKSNWHVLQAARNGVGDWDAIEA